MRWALAGPEAIRVISEFECASSDTETITPTKHHEQTQFHQKRFGIQVQSFVQVIESYGNPFDDNTSQLVRLHNREIMDETSVRCLTTIKERGQEQYQAFIEERLHQQLKPINDPIVRNKISLFNTLPQKTKSAMASGLLKAEANLFARLYVACQSRDGDIDEFFRHENHAYPPALSSYGQIRQGKKADLMSCLEQSCQPQGQSRPLTDVTVLDGAAVVNFLLPGANKSFGDYATNVFLPYIGQQIEKSCRLDIVWDQYHEDSLKSQTRETRGSGSYQRIRVQPNGPIPKNWHQFLRVSENKTEIFSLLNDAAESTPLPPGKELVLTDGPGVTCIPMRDTSALAPCNHEEADTRMMVHIADITNRGYSTILVRSVDTDVVVLAVATVAKIEISELWIAFGTAKDFRYIAAHEIANSLGPIKSVVLPVFHALTGCDTTSSFAQIGKKTAWKAWTSHEDVTTALHAIHDSPSEVSDGVFRAIEQFTIAMYDRTSTTSCIDNCRKLLFTRKGRQMTSLPPTKDALLQHLKRATYQGGHDWGTATTPFRQLPSPGDWGWCNPDKWQPVWTTTPQASEACTELVKCKCRSRCITCKCALAHLKCTNLCTCHTDCENA